MQLKNKSGTPARLLQPLAPPTSRCPTPPSNLPNTQHLAAAPPATKEGLGDAPRLRVTSQLPLQPPMGHPHQQPLPLLPQAGQPQQTSLVPSPSSMTCSAPTSCWAMPPARACCRRWRPASAASCPAQRPCRCCACCGCWPRWAARLGPQRCDSCWRGWRMQVQQHQQQHQQEHQCGRARLEDGCLR